MSAYASRPGIDETAPAAWKDARLADLCTHLATVHHARLRAELPRLAQLMAEVTSRPGPHQATLQAASRVLERFATDMRAHLDYEETAIFPLIAGLESGRADREQARRVLYEQSLELESAHVCTGADLDELHRICDTVQASAETEPLLCELLDLLGRIITDTYLHLEKENQILMPRALGLLAPRG